MLKDLPIEIKGFTAVNKDGNATIVLNARLNRFQQRLTYLHELKHIKNDDVHSNCTASQIEKLRH